MDEENKVVAKQSRFASWSDLWTTLAIIGAALVVAVLIISFVFRSYQVDGPSMEDTLMNNDKLIVWKWPVTWAHLTGSQYVPRQGDIIIFTETNLARFGQQNTKVLIKRVIGLPGDTVVVNNGKYTVYDKQHPKGFDPDYTLPYGKHMDPQGTVPYTAGDHTYKLGPHQLFVSGDNRPDSLDSRFFGPINTNQVIGQLILRVYPLNKAEIF